MDVIEYPGRLRQATAEELDPDWQPVVWCSRDGIEVRAYDVLQIRDTNFGCWLDYSTIRDTTEALIAVRLVQLHGGADGHRRADYRIQRRSSGQVVAE